MFGKIVSLAFTLNLIFGLIGNTLSIKLGIVGYFITNAVPLFCSCVITLYTTKRLMMSLYCVVGLLAIWGIVIFVNPRVPDEDHPINTLYGVSQGLTQLEKTVVTENPNASDQLKFLWKFRFNIPYYPLFYFWKQFGFATKKSFDALDLGMEKAGLLTPKENDETSTQDQNNDNSLYKEDNATVNVNSAELSAGKNKVSPVAKEELTKPPTDFKSTDTPRRKTYDEYLKEIEKNE